MENGIKLVKLSHKVGSKVKVEQYLSLNITQEINILKLDNMIIYLMLMMIQEQEK